MGFSALFVLLLITLPVKDSICLRDENAKILLQVPVKNRETFDIQFRHSVNKGMIVERYEVDTKEGKIALVTGFFESYGAGMLDTVPENVKFKEENGMMRLDFEPVFQDDVIYRSAGIANHEFICGEKRYRLFDISPYKAINISVEKMSIIKYIFVENNNG